MDDPSNTNPQRPRLHPLVATAAIAVIALSAVGIATFAMNRSSATPSPYDAPPVATQSALPPAAQPVAPGTPLPRANGNVPSVPVYSVPEPTRQAYETPARTAPAYDSPQRVAVAEPACRACGTVEAIHDIKVKGQATGVGAVGGAVVGGLLGNMVGAGRGKALATVAGAVGGGFGGNAIEKNVRSEIEHQMIVRLDNGGTRTFTQTSPFPYREGERVRIVDGHVERG